jgi:hypothetical protein
VKPDCTVYLDELVRSLMHNVAPALPTSWAQADVMRHSLLLQVVEQEFDRAAAWRVDDNAALRVLFGEASAVVVDSAMKQRLNQACASADASLRVSDLDAANQGLRGLLTELHAHVEALDGPQARALEARIWRELAASTVRRQCALDRF